MDNKSIKILFVGAGGFPIYEAALFHAALNAGYRESELFTYNSYFKDGNIFKTILNRFEFKMSVGPDIVRLGADLLKKCQEYKPDIVFLYSCRLLRAKYVIKIKELGIYIANYCNDDPYSDFHEKYFWRNWRNTAKIANINYVYRKGNLKDVKKDTSNKAKLMMPYYISSDNYPCNENEIIRNTPSVIFLGHYEEDERTEYIQSLFEEGIDVGLNRSEFSFMCQNDHAIFLDEPRLYYNRYISSCKIPLVFLSKINHDTYTRRCFEIPAAGAFLLCPYTDDLAELFAENQEIVFYHNKEEFVEKIKYFLRHDEERQLIAKKGMMRILGDGHEAADRVEEIMEDYTAWLSSKGEGIV